MYQHFRGENRLKNAFCYLLGLTTGMLLWEYGFIVKTESLRSELRKTNEHLQNFSAKTKPVGIVSQGKGSSHRTDISDEEIANLSKLLERKLQDMKDTGVLAKMGKQRLCTSNDTAKDLCIDANCTSPLPLPTSRENIRSVLTPLTKVGRDKLRNAMKAFDVEVERKKYVIVTGASSSHFRESETLIHSLQKTILPHLSNYSFYYYDLGLTEEQRQLIREFSGAELRSFPFKKLPTHVQYLNCYSWKPLIVLAHLQHCDFLIWMDSSVRFQTRLDPYIHNASKTGLVISSNTLPMALHTVQSLFSYFGDKPCQFSIYEEMETGLVVFHSEPLIRRLFVEPWGACALDPSCLCPSESRNILKCPHTDRSYGQCHRYDKSALGYIVIKLFRENYRSVFINKHCHFVARGRYASFLSYLQKRKKNPKSE